MNTLHSNSNVVGFFVVNCRTVMSLTGSHPPPSLAHIGSCTRAHGFVCIFNEKQEMLKYVTNAPEGPLY